MAHPKSNRRDGPMHSTCEEYICPCHERLQQLIMILENTKSGALILEEFFYKDTKDEIPTDKGQPGR